MPNPLIIDCHLHLYESKDKARWGKDHYDIWEYGDKAGVHSSKFAGDVHDALDALNEAGATKAVAPSTCSAYHERGSKLSRRCPED